MAVKFRALLRAVGLVLVLAHLFGSVLFIAFLLQGWSKKRKRYVAACLKQHLAALRFCCGLKLNISGEMPPCDRPFLLLANHISYWDIVALGSLRPMGFMAKDAIAAWPLVGRLTRACQTIYVRRECSYQRWRALKELQAQAGDLSYCVFPEGTTTLASVPEFRNWRRGNISLMRDPGIPVWLAAIRYAQQNDDAWIDDQELLPHIWKSLQKKSIEVAIEFRPLVPQTTTLLAEQSNAAYQQLRALCQKLELRN